MACGGLGRQGGSALPPVRGVWRRSGWATVGAGECTPLCGPPAGPGLLPRAGLSLTTGQWAACRAGFEDQRPFPTALELQPAGPVVRVQSKQEEPPVGQAGPPSLFGEGIRPSGFAGLSTAKVGGGCRPGQERGETPTTQGAAWGLGTSLLGFCPEGLPWQLLALTGASERVLPHPWVSPCLCHRAQVAALPGALGFPLVSLDRQPRPDGGGCPLVTAVGGPHCPGRGPEGRPLGGERERERLRLRV